MSTFASIAFAEPSRTPWSQTLRLLGAIVALALVATASTSPRAEDVAEPVRLDNADDASGLPVPRGATQVTRSSGPILSELNAAVAADPAAVFAFYRRELGQRGWKEDTTGAVDSAAQIRRGFSSAEGSAVLVLGRVGDGTTVSLVIHASEEVVAARALEAREAERASRGESIVDPDILKDDPDGASLAKGGDLLRARGDAATPIPVPEAAEAVAHDSQSGRLTFTSGATVRSLEIFYRTAMKRRGFSERAVEPRPGVAEVEFVKGDEQVLLTFVRDAGTVKVTAVGNALIAVAR